MELVAVGTHRTWRSESQPTCSARVLSRQWPASWRFGMPSRCPCRAGDRSDSGTAGPDAHRPVRLEGPARQPPVVRGRRLPERDGHHQPAPAHRKHLVGP
jgi:hypothetical protein